MGFVINWLIGWPARVAQAQTLRALAPLLARIVTGWEFMWSGWGKLQDLPRFIKLFGEEWHIPAPEILTPFVSGVEFFGGIFLVLGLFTRLSGGALAVVMLVAIKSAKWDQVDSLESLVGFDESEYFALFTWLAIAGAGKLSLDHLLTRAKLPPEHPE
jgi:putative oxidoreductase